MRLVLWLGLLASAAQGEPLRQNAAEIQGFVDYASDQYGEFGKQAAAFLVEGMPPQDLENLQRDFLIENLDLAMEARDRFPWGKMVPQEVFFNDVLPYASLDETREPWRKSFFEKASLVVAGCQTTAEAAQALNKSFFDVVGVHYNTGRKRPNQSPSESIGLGKATCTGLSIILVDACRAVGVPARVAGTPMWTDKRGNHTWVEIWDQNAWHFAGADEYKAEGLDRGWFAKDASQAIADNWEHAIWASSWKKSGSHFPMVWDPTNKNVAAVNVTASYARAKQSVKKTEQTGQVDETIVFFRCFSRGGGDRLVATVEVFDGAGEALGSVVTKAGQSDLNDMPSLPLLLNHEYAVRLKYNGETRETKLATGSSPTATVEWNWDDLVTRSPSASDGSDREGDLTARLEQVATWLKSPPADREASLPTLSLSQAEAAEAARLIWGAQQREEREQRSEEMKNHVVRAGDNEMKYLEKAFGDAPEGERSLWISLHGGGGTTDAVNSQQWRNQIRLYEPHEGIVVAPRAPTDSWNMWHQDHVDGLLDRLIQNYVAVGGVSADRVYLMGYSAGGDGVYQLAPRMADRFAAAAMMAGHPNNASPLGLRNLPFMIFMGGDDGAYHRNETARRWEAELGALRIADASGYEHKVTIYPGLGHWMEGKDAEALPWMASRTRNVWPRRVVWRPRGRGHDRFYWLATPSAAEWGGQVVRADVDGQRIEITTDGEWKSLQLRLSDELVDLDKALAVVVNGKEVYSGSPQRSVEAIWRSMQERLDPGGAASSHVVATP